ncbi:hypothetical protein [Lysinibacillus sp. NPDC047702]|uniref:hypothetical protein n=1 Tax=unclassified Lysinibacillus TaxID=2636778 RepID=UPI003CFD2328
MKKFFKRKAIQSESCENGGDLAKKKGAIGQLFNQGTSLYGKWCFAIFVLDMLVQLLKKLYIVLPSIIHFLESLVSTLSYLYKKEFFYEFFTK